MGASVFKVWLWIHVTLACLLFATNTALAHNVTVFAWVETGQVHTQSKFSGGKRVKGGKIEVFDHQDTKVMEGTTDQQGYFAFPVPGKAQTLKIVLTAGMGHGNHWILTAQELGAATPGTAGKETVRSAGDAENQEAEPTVLDVNAVERIVEKALDRKLAPLKARMADQAWGLRDILGGLGYILGLVGLAAYVQHRKQQPPVS